MVILLVAETQRRFEQDTENSSVFELGAQISELTEPIKLLLRFSQRQENIFLRIILFIEGLDHKLVSSGLCWYHATFAAKTKYATSLHVIS